MQGVNHPLLVHLEVEGVIGIRGVLGGALLRLIPTDHFAHVFIKGFAFGNVFERKYAFAVDARATNLHPTPRRW